MLRSHGRRLLSQLRSQRGLSLTEVLVALTITATILAGAVSMIASWSTATRTLPVAGARGASDAQVQQMIAELRNTVAVTYVSGAELVARVNTAANYPTAPVINGTPTGAYSVAFYYWADAHTLYRNGSGVPAFNGPTDGWQALADNLAGLSFAGYDANMNPTTIPSQVSTIGITVQYQGLPPEQEMLTLRGTSMYTASYSHPLTIPPQPVGIPPGVAGVAPGGGGGDHSGPATVEPNPQTARSASLTGPGFDINVSTGTPTTDMVQVGNPAFASGVSGPYSGTASGYGPSTLDAAAAAVAAAHKLETQVSQALDAAVGALNTALQGIADRMQAATPGETSPPGTSGDGSTSNGDTSSGNGTGGSSNGDSGGGGGENE